MKHIHGTPEGRPGIWLITPETAVAVIDFAPGDTVHNFIGHEAIMLGADWEKEHARQFFLKREHRIALIFPPNVVMHHHLVALNDEKRWSFDVGPLSESQMVAVPSQGR